MAAEPIQVLVVCTANQCRSPMAEALARAAFEGMGANVRVSSAGTNALPNYPATEYAELTMAKRGLDVRNHSSRHIDEAGVDGADMIWCMERQHVVEIGAKWPAAMAVTFTLLDLERRAAQQHRHPSESICLWLHRIGDERRAVDVLGDSENDDVADPIGRSLRRYRKTAVRLSLAVDTIVAAMNIAPGGSVPPGAEPRG